MLTSDSRLKLCGSYREVATLKTDRAMSWRFEERKDLRYRIIGRVLLVYDFVVSPELYLS